MLPLGPGSSETDDNELGVVEEVELVANGNLATPIHKLVVEEEEEESVDMSARIIHKTTPTTTSRSSPTSYNSKPASSAGSRATPTTSRITQVGGASSTKTRPSPVSKRQTGGTRVFDKESNNESQTSDTEMTSTSALSLSSQKGVGGAGGRRKFDSDLSTAPFSSETSDMSEGEKGMRRHGSPPPDPPPSGIPRPSPKLPRKAVSLDTSRTDEAKSEATPPKVEATPTSRGIARPVKAGNFVSKRTSVSAMISQFDAGPSKKPGSHDNGEGTGSSLGRVPPPRPHPPVKSSLSSRPNLRPKPSGITSKQASPPRATPTKPTPTEETTDGSGEKRNERTKPGNTRLSPAPSSVRTKSSTESTSGDSSSSHNEGGVASGRSSGSGTKLSGGNGNRTKTVSKDNATKSSIKKGNGDSKSNGETKSAAGKDSDETKSVGAGVGGVQKQVGGATKPTRPLPPRNIKRPVSTATSTTATNRLSLVKTTPTGRQSPSNGGGASSSAKLKGVDDIQLLANKVKPNGGTGNGTGNGTGSTAKRTKPTLPGRYGSSDKLATPTSATPTATKLTASSATKKEEKADVKAPPTSSDRKTPTLDKRIAPVSVEKKTTPTTTDTKAPPTLVEKSPPTPVDKKPPPTPIERKTPPTPVERKTPPTPKLPPTPTDRKSPPTPIDKTSSTSSDEKSMETSEKGEGSVTKEPLERTRSSKRPSPRRPPPEPPTSPLPTSVPTSPPLPLARKTPPPIPPPFQKIKPLSVTPPQLPPKAGSKATPPTLPTQRTPISSSPLQKAAPPTPGQKAPPPPPKLNDSKSELAQNYEEFVPTLHRSASVSSQTTPLSPPIAFPPEESHYEGVTIPRAFSVGSMKRSNQSSEPVEAPPPLPPRNYIPDDPVISLPVALTTVDERDGPTTPTLASPNADVPPPLPSQPIPKRKSLLSHLPSPPSSSPLLKRKEIPASLLRSSPTLPVRVTPISGPSSNQVNIYEEINLGPSPIRSRSNSASSSLKRTVEQHYEVSDSYRGNESPKTTTGFLRTSSSGECYYK